MLGKHFILTGIGGGDGVAGMATVTIGMVITIITTMVMVTITTTTEAIVE